MHPQLWNDSIDYTNKRVVVIGSGATAVTLVPALAAKAAHVTMLQRSPTYVVSRPEGDAIANWLRENLPAELAYDLARWKNVLYGIVTYQFSRRYPDKMRSLIIGGVRQALGKDYAVSKHFNPSYKPWDQRVCLIPDGDLFKAIVAGSAEVVTDHIERFTQTGIMLRSGAVLEADLVVTATGLQLEVGGGATTVVDGKTIDPADTFMYKGMMLSGVPNSALSVGYTNASWTLKVELICEYVCRLLNHMDKHGYAQGVVRVSDETMEEQPLLDFSAGYVLRGQHLLPKQGLETPWRLYQNYILDRLMIRHGRLEDGFMQFS